MGASPDSLVDKVASLFAASRGYGGIFRVYASQMDLKIGDCVLNRSTNHLCIDRNIMGGNLSMTQEDMVLLFVLQQRSCGMVISKELVTQWLLEVSERLELTEGGWESAMEGWLQDLRSGGRYRVTHQLLIRMLLARHLRRVYFTTYAKKSGLEEFGARLEFLLRNAQKIFRAPSVQLCIEGKRIPPLSEAIRATLRRLAFIEVFVARSCDAVEGVVIWGSMSYGAFYCVRGKQGKFPAPDIDVIVVMRAEPSVKWYESLRQLPMSVPQLALLESRIRVFEQLWGEGAADLISQVFKVRGFEVSIHFFPSTVFRDMTGDGLVQIYRLSHNAETYLSDYKTNPFRHRYSIHRNMHGEALSCAVTQGKRVPHGYLMKLLSHGLRSGRFYPGIYHNLIAPEFWVAYDQERQVQVMTENYRSFLRSRVVAEGLPDTALLMAHPRAGLFENDCARGEF
jgi:hypothetical protein